MTDHQTESAVLDVAEVVRCSCAHLAIDHHGSDPSDGCLGVASHRMPQCPCRRTCKEVCDGAR